MRLSWIAGFAALMIFAVASAIRSNGYTPANHPVLSEAYRDSTHAYAALVYAYGEGICIRLAAQRGRDPWTTCDPTEDTR